MVVSFFYCFFFIKMLIHVMYSQIKDSYFPDFLEENYVSLDIWLMMSVLKLFVFIFVITFLVRQKHQQLFYILLNIPFLMLTLFHFHIYASKRMLLWDTFKIHPRLKSTRVQNPPDQNQLGQTREPLTGLG